MRPYCDEVSLMYGQRARVVHVSVILHRPRVDCKTRLCNQTDQHNDEDATYNTPITTAQCVRYTSNTRRPWLARCPGSVYLMTANKAHNIKNFRLIQSVIFCIFYQTDQEPVCYVFFHKGTVWIFNSVSPVLQCST